MRAAVEQLAPQVGVAPACRALGVARASVYRHRQPPRPRPDPGPRRSPRALAPAERARVLATLHEDRFVDQAPAAVYATLLEEGRYLCSVRTMYRLLHGVGEVRERRRQRRHPRAEPPRLVATAPNQVWTWDITHLAGPRRGGTYPLYVVLDLFSRYVVAWMVATQESADRARRLVQAACHKQAIEPGQLTLHQDRGAPMTAKSFSQLLVDLEILASYNRPRTADDNPYSESQFKTVKSAPSYPGRFADPAQARTWCRSFSLWYNTRHRHSGLGLLTPESVHQGRAGVLQAERQLVLEEAYTRHPERFVQGPPQASRIPDEVWINPPPNTIECAPEEDTKLSTEVSHSP